MADDGLEFGLDGLEDIQNTFKVLSDDVKYKGGRFALRKAAQLVRDVARKNAQSIDDPDTREQISKNIVERWNGRQFKRTGDLGFRVGILGGARSTGKQARATALRRARSGQASLESLGEIAGAGKNNPGGDTFYWRFVEFGTSKSRAQPFFRSALAENVGQSTNEFIAQYDKALGRALKRAQKSVTPSRRRKAT